MTDFQNDDEHTPIPRSLEEATRRPTRKTREINIYATSPRTTAQAFLEVHTDPLIRFADRWYAWRSGVYTQVHDEEIDTSISMFLDPAGKFSIKRTLHFEQMDRHVNEVRKAMERLCHPRGLADPGSTRGFWLRNAGPDPKELLNCRNGILHLPTRTLMAPTPDFFCEGRTEIDFDADAGPPVAFLGFLASLELLPEEITLLQQMAGYLLQYGNPMQKVFLIVGPTRAGKGVFERVLTKLIGERHVGGLRAPLDDRFDLEHMIGKSLGLVSDLRLSPKSDVTSFVQKLLTISGHDLIVIPRKNKSAHNAPLPLNILMTSNEIPCLTDRGSAIAGRLIPIVLTKSHLEQEDLTLEARLAAELPAILNWALDGYDRVMQLGRFVLPASSMHVRRQIEGQASPVSSFIRDQCELAIGAVTPKEVLRQAFDDFCSFHDFPVLQDSRFGAALKAAHPTVGTRRVRDGKGKRVWCYMNIRLRPVADDE